MAHFIILFQIFFGFIPFGMAQSTSGKLTVFDIRKSLPLSDSEATAKDFYINSGEEAGLKKGSYVAVMRAVPVHDPVQNKQQAMLSIMVGYLKIIQVERNIAVARRVQELSDEERPTLEFEGIMIGDQIDLKSMSNDPPKPSKKSKS